jgi:spore coat protein A, manganese oxidase
MRRTAMFLLAVPLCVVLFCATTASAQLLNPLTLTKYVDPMPQPPVQTQDGWHNGVKRYDVHIRQAKVKMHSQLDSTTLFTYDGVFPGPSFHCTAYQPIYVRFINDLPQNHILHADTTVRLMSGTGWGQSSRHVTRVQGADNPPAYDGHPLGFIYPGEESLYWYPNSHPAATLWYHDRTAGISRLNLYSGEAGFYVITDIFERNLNMPSGQYELEIMQTDRTFYSNGRLFYPDTWVPEFYGNVSVANGVIWPRLEVEPRKYRIHLLNGCLDRFLSMKLLQADSAGKVGPDSIGGPAFYMVGTEQGLVQNTVVLNDPTKPNSPRLLLAPSDRRDLIIDFAGQQGKYFLMHNNAPAPLNGAFPQKPLPELWLVHVKVMTDSASIPMHPRSVRKYQERAARLTRDVFLHEIKDSLGGVTTALLNDQTFTDPVTDFPKLNSTEVWRFINATSDVEPMHIPLVNFQVLDRTPFRVDMFLLDHSLIFTGPPEPPTEQELGYRDVVNATPGYVTRVVTSQFNRLGQFVYGCDLFSCGDNEMLRPYQVTQTGGGPQGAESAPMPASLYLAPGQPEPFRGHTLISYGVPYEQHVSLSLYNVVGREVKNLVNGTVKIGHQRVTWDGTDDSGSRVAAGTYFCKLQTAAGSVTRRVTLLR